MKKVENIKNYNGINKRMTLKALSLLMSGVMATSFGSCNNNKQNGIEETTANYEYHIYGIDENGNVIESLKEDPKFGMKMFGNYIILGDSNGLIKPQSAELPSLLGNIVITESGQVVNIPVYKNVYESSLPIEEYKDYAGFEYNKYDTYDEIAIDAIKENRGQFLGSRPMKNINNDIMFFMNISKSYNLDKIKEDYPESEGYTIVDNGDYYQVRRMNEVIYTAPNGFVRKGDKAIMSANLTKKTVQEFEKATVIYDPTITEEDYSLYDGFEYIEGEEQDYVSFSATRRIIYSAPNGFTFNGTNTEMTIANSTNGITDDLREKYPESEGYTITEDGNKIIITHPVIENIEYLIPEGFNITIRNGIVYACKFVNKINNINKLTKGLN